MLSILISSYKRLEYLRRTLFSLNKFPPKCEWELVVANEISNQDSEILAELQKYTFKWKIILCDLEAYLAKFNLIKYGAPICWTNNVAYKYSKGDIIVLLGNDIIIVDDAINKLLEAIPNHPDYILYSACYHCPIKFLTEMGEYGENIGRIAHDCLQWPLQCYTFTNGVTNYLSISPRCTWEKLEGYDENYIKGVAGDDSDFTFRVRAANGKHVYSKTSNVLHQDHGGLNLYRQTFANREKQNYWEHGLSTNRCYLNSLPPNVFKNRQSWKWGWSEGFKVISNYD